LPGPGSKIDQVDQVFRIVADAFNVLHQADENQAIRKVAAVSCSRKVRHHLFSNPALELVDLDVLLLISASSAETVWRKNASPALQKLKAEPHHQREVVAQILRDSRIETGSEFLNIRLQRHPLGYTTRTQRRTVSRIEQTGNMEERGEEPFQMVRLPLALFVTALAAFGQYTMKPAAVPAADVAPAIASELQKQGAQILTGDGKVYCEIWLKAQAPQGPETSETDVSWKTVPHGALIGVIRFPEGGKDRRGQAIKPGVYTLRFSYYPVDGAHQGAEPTRDFLILTPAANDQDAKATPAFSDLMVMGRKASGTITRHVWQSGRPAAIFRKASPRPVRTGSGPPRLGMPRFPLSSPASTSTTSKLPSPSDRSFTVAARYLSAFLSRARQRAAGAYTPVTSILASQTCSTWSSSSHVQVRYP
jgi:hypothetical protein